MNYTLPHTIQNKYGEKIIFQRMEGNRLYVDGFCVPGAGPGFHTHLQQDESFTVVSGKIGYQIYGQEAQYGGVGDTVIFKRGIPHRFWNAGEDELHVSGWIDPADNLVFFLSNLYFAFDHGAKNRPEAFDGAYLSLRFKNEYDVPDIPGFVKKVIMPITFFIGKILGKYKKFENAPSPLPAAPC